jgi:hypothetical protein
MLSRNSASSRAIPVEKLVQRVIDDPVIPLYIGANQRGMQTGAELAEGDRQFAVEQWLAARDRAVGYATRLAGAKVHKAIVNRLIEPWMWITVIISATEWDNFFGLRCHKDAEPHFQHIAEMMRDAMEYSAPDEAKVGEWHLPLWSAHEDEKAVEKLVNEGVEGHLAPDDAFMKIACKVSIGRCARVSYLTHDGKRDIAEDIALHDRMVVAEPLHASPAEHVAQALADPTRIGNYIGWRQYRKMLPNEHIGGPMP